jgi:hypothetical protein
LELQLALANASEVAAYKIPLDLVLIAGVFSPTIILEK